MAMPMYQINFTDGTTQTLPTPGPKLEGEGEWITFRDGTGVQLCIRASEVESIIRSDTPERSSKQPEAA